MAEFPRITIRVPPLSRVQVQKRSRSDSQMDTVYPSTSSSILSDPTLTESEKWNALREMALNNFPLKPDHMASEVERIVRFLKEGSKITAFGPFRAICRCGQSLVLDTRTYYAWHNWGKHQAGRCHFLSAADVDKENTGPPRGLDLQEEEDINGRGGEEDKSLDIGKDPNELYTMGMNYNTPTYTTERQAMVRVTYPIPHIEPTAFHATLRLPHNLSIYGTDQYRHPMELAKVLSELPTNLVIFVPTKDDTAALSINPNAHDRRRAGRTERKYSPMCTISNHTSGRV